MNAGDPSRARQRCPATNVPSPGPDHYREAAILPAILPQESTHGTTGPD